MDDERSFGMSDQGMEKSVRSLGRAVITGGEESAFRRYTKDEGRFARTERSEVISHESISTDLGVSFNFTLSFQIGAFFFFWKL